MKTSSRTKKARLAGLLYLILIISGIIGIIYIPSQLITWDSPSETLANLSNSQFLFKIGILSELICYLSFLFLSFVLYDLLKIVSKTYAALMVVFILVSIPMAFVNVLNKFSVLTFLKNAEYLKNYDIDEIATQVMVYLNFYNNGTNLIYIFWGLWLFPFGYLVYKSGFLPKILGIFLMIGCFSYLIEFIGPFLFSTYGDHKILAAIVGIPSSIGEFGICLWLLIMGTNRIKIGKKADTTVGSGF